MRRRAKTRMKTFDLSTDIELITDLCKITLKEFAEEIGVDVSTIHRWRSSQTQISATNLSAVYDFAFRKKIRINKIKEQLCKEECEEDSIILFHGAKTNIEGSIDLEKSKSRNDFGKGFYCGESLEQSAMFVSGYNDSSLYIAKFNKKGLESGEFSVNRDWMLAIAFFRGKLDNYSKHPIISSIISKINSADYIIAPIADNRMFEIIDSFIEGEITDIQCQHCLSATNLGKQYVLKTEKALKKFEILHHCYLCKKEKEFYLSAKQDEAKIGTDKVKVAKKQYRGQGLYIEEILDD